MDRDFEKRYGFVVSVLAIKSGEFKNVFTIILRSK